MFSTAEFERRVAAAREAMRAAGVDVLIVDQCELMAWLSGYTVSETRYRAVLLPLSGAPWIVLRALDEAPCREKSWIADVSGFSDCADPVAEVAASLAERGFGNGVIGADFNSYDFSAHTLARFMRALPQARFVDMNGVSDSLRWVKSGEEIAVLAEAAAIASGAMLDIRAHVGEGSTTRDAAARAAAYFLQHGADTGEVGPIVRAAGDHQFLHGVFKTDALRRGDILHVELIPKVDGYCARTMRPLSIGPADEARRALARELVRLQDLQIAAMKPGAAARDVDAVMRRGALLSGLRAAYDNVTAYTLGIYSRTPRSSDFSRALLPDAEWTLEENMVFHVYTTAGGLGFSETVVVTPEGGRTLTTVPRQILVAG
jgi:Xaa-Pro dipeptidase